MPHVLFIMERFHTDAQIGKTNNYWNLLGSYECSKLGTYEVCYIDPNDIWSTQGVDEAILNHPADAIFISVYHHLPSQQIAQQFGHKMCYAWWDSIVSMGGVNHWANYAHQLCFDWGKGEEQPNVFCVEVPQDTRIFQPQPDIKKEFDVCFVGSITSYWPDRKQIVDMIQKAGINIWANGGRGHGLLNLPIEKYVNIFHSSKICLNLAAGHGKVQRKGRVFELGHTGAFMMSDHPEVLQNWFEEGKDFIGFNTDNLIEKIKYYLEHDDERNIIANNFYQKTINNYAPSHFWSKVLKICGVTI